MKLYVCVKQAGKRKEYITRKQICLEKVPANLRELISMIVSLNVQEYNSKQDQPSITDFLTDNYIEKQATIGKIGFAQRHNPAKANLSKAIDTALLAFEDGIYRVFHGEDEITSLDGGITLAEGDVMTFIRLTMLAGRKW